MGIYNDLVFTEALELVNFIIYAEDIDQITDRLEEIAKHEDLALSVMSLMYMKLRGVDTTQLNGVELANTKPTIRDLILPPGVKR